MAEVPRPVVASTEQTPESATETAPEPTTEPARDPVVVADVAGAGTSTGDAALGELATVGDYDEELTLSLIFEILYRNSLWPDEPVQ